MEPDDNPPATLAGRRERMGLAVLSLSGLLLSVDASVIFLALPRISGWLQASSSDQLWITDVYGFMLAGFLVTMGRLGDLIGRRRLLLTGAAIFGEISVIAAYSTDATSLIAARALLGVAGATIVPSAMALIATMFPNAKQQAMAIAVFVSCFMGGAVLGPVIGGLLLTRFWWGSVFLLNVPVMLLVVLTGPALLPECTAPAGTKLDLVSVVLYLCAVLPLIYGINELGQVRWQVAPIIGVLVGLVFAVVFLRNQRRTPDPLLDLKLFRHRAFNAVLAISLFGGAAIAAMGLYFTQFVQVVKGWSPLSTGGLTVITAVSMITGSLIAPGVARRVRPGTVVTVGLGLMTIGFLLISRVRVHGSLTVLIVGVAVVTLGAGAFVSVGTGLLMGSVPAEKVGAAASVSETSGELGSALGIATLGSIGIAVYRHLLIVPTSVSAVVTAKSRHSATDNLIRAKELSDNLPGKVRSVIEYTNNETVTHVVTTTTSGVTIGGRQVITGGGVSRGWSTVDEQGLGSALLNAAKSAFTTAFQSVTLIAAIVAAGLAVLAFVMLRQAPPTGVEEASGATGEAAPAETAMVVAAVPAGDVSSR